MVVMCTCGGVDGGHVCLWGCLWWSCVPVGALMVVMCTYRGVDGGHVYLWGC